MTTQQEALLECLLARAEGGQALTPVQTLPLDQLVLQKARETRTQCLKKGLARLFRRARVDRRFAAGGGGDVSVPLASS